MKQIRHDAFAREAILRETVYTSKTCDFCGNAKHTFDGTPYLYRYYVEQDGINTRPEPIKGLFCSIGCMRAYNNN